MSNNHFGNWPLAMLIIAIMACFTQPSHGQDELNVIGGNKPWLAFTNTGNHLYGHFAEEAYGHLEARRKLIGGLQSLDAWKERQRWIRNTLDEAVGPFPEKTPLNAKVVRTVKKDGYRIEHITYESRPEFYVTASLFIPSSLKGRERAPVVIYCSGHSAEGYRSRVYQHVIVNLVRKGFAVFAFDPVGQGERLQYWDADKGKSAVGGPTTEHSYPGSQAFLAGTSQAQYMTWDGIRAVDYLLTRKEIDPRRIGITGRSGGGTQSAYIAAFDDRIKAAAPECYITSFKRLLQSIGPQDAEQNLVAGISKGLDHSDLLLVRAPKPALMITTTRDMFSIQGARETAKEVSRIYEAYGEPADFSMVEDDAAHASTKRNREAMYAFFQKHLDHPGSAADEEIIVPTKEELTVTTTGQVLTSLGGETLHSMNLKGLHSKSAALAHARQSKDHASGVIAKAKNITGYDTPDKDVEPVFTGRIQRDGYSIEKYFVSRDGGYIIPYLLITPARGNGRSILYLHPDGKNTEAGAGQEIEDFVKEGYAVLAPDLLGTGEMGSGDFKGDAYIQGVSHNIWYSAILVGKSISGLHSRDVARLIEIIKKRSPDHEIIGIARNEMTSVLLHAAAFIPDIKMIALFEPLISYKSLVENRLYHSAFIPFAVAGTAGAYDLADLAASLAPRKLLMVNPVNGANLPLENGESADDLTFIRNAFAANGGAENLKVIQNGEVKGLRIPDEWLR